MNTIVYVLDEPSAARLLGAGGDAVELPRSVREVLVHVVRELVQGNAVASPSVHARGRAVPGPPRS